MDELNHLIIEKDNNDAAQHPANRYLQKSQKGALQGKRHRAERDSDGEVEGNQPGGVVHQRLPFDHAHHGFGHASFTDNAGQRHGVRWRQNGGQGKRGGEGD